MADCAPSGDTVGLLGATRLDVVPELGPLDGLEPEAATLLRELAAELSTDLERPEPWHELGAALHAHGRIAPARTCYEQALLRAPDDAQAWYWLALLEEAEDPARSLRLLEQCARAAPEHAPAHWRAGYLLLAADRLAEAESAFRAALACAPGDEAAAVGLARVLLQAGRAAEAARLLEEHVQRVPQDRHALHLLGTALRELGRSAEAERALAGGAGTEPLQRDPWREELLARRRGARADFLRAVERLDRGQVDAALPELEALHRRDPRDVLVLVALHRAYRMQGELERALALLVAARDLEPTSDVVHLHLAGAYRERARRAGEAPERVWLERALASSERACELAPTHAAAVAMHADVLGDLGRTEEALAGWARAAELEPGAPAWQEKAGLALCRSGRWGAAVPFLRRLAALQPRSPQVLLQLGAALANSGQLEEAAVMLERARSLAPGDPAIQKAVQDLARSRSGAGGGRR
ncbi:MAG TPA: tetratricopeptide repeat protein [Planctomycetota bacterium]